MPPWGRGPAYLPQELAVVMHTLILSMGRQRQMDLSEFEARVVHTASSRIAKVLCGTLSQKREVGAPE